MTMGPTGPEATTKGAEATAAVTVVVDDRLQSVLELLDRHVAGEATNVEVEMAVAQLLGTNNGTTTTNGTAAVSAANATIKEEKNNMDDVVAASAAADAYGSTKGAAYATTQGTEVKRKVAAPKAIPEIDEDMANYDEDDDEDDDYNGKPTSNSTSSNDLNLKVQIGSSTRKRRRMQISSKDGSVLIEEEPFSLDSSLYADIPLGYQGALMMVTFGDGRRPLPDAVQATLCGVRKMLQVAIQDARYLRRRHRQLYASAQRSVGLDMNKMGRQLNKHVKYELSTEIMFQASVGHDPLAKDQKCGFAMADLHILFPEELNAFLRCCAIHEKADEAAKVSGPAKGGGKVDGEETAATEDLDEDVAAAAAEAAGVEEGTAASTTTTANTTTNTEDLLLLDNEEEQQQAIKDGHLHERAEQFDVRTHRMPDGWYLTYSNKLRQGSFLPIRQNRGNSTTRDDSTSATGGWGKLKLQAIRFLHWVGFDPESPTLPPPNEDTVHALAFLAYDFLGRIVEKAIALRKYGATSTVPRHEQVLELDGDDGQLTAEDIATAMTDLNPLPLYSSNKSLAPSDAMRGVKAHPLYFGPGFEKRLEMEIEEFMLERTLTPEEQQMRQQEDDFFASLGAKTTSTSTNAVDASPFSETPNGDDTVAAVAVADTLPPAPSSSEPPPKKKRRLRKSL